MAPGPFELIPLLVVFASLGDPGNELLDLVDSETYWKVAGIERSAESLMGFVKEEDAPEADLGALEKHVANLASPEFVARQKALAALTKAGPVARPVLEKAKDADDPEVATAVRGILAKLGDSSTGGHIHKLMAIRTLGEMKAEAAVPHLETLSDSDEPFVADYAARALAEIRGEAFVPRKPDPLVFKKDLSIGHPSITALFHTAISPRTGQPGIRAAVEDAMDVMGGLGPAGVPGGIGFPELDEILEEMTGDLAEVAKRIGNIRLESITATVPTGVDPDTGGVIFTIRGQFDRDRLAEFIRGESGGEEVRIGGVDWITDGMDFFIHLPSDNLAVMVAGSGVKPFVEAVSKRLSGEDKTPAAGPAVVLAKDVPPDATTVFAAEIPDALAEGEEALQVFDAFVGWMTPSEKEGEKRLTVRGVGANKEKIAGLHAQGNLFLAMGKGALTMAAKSEEKLAPIADLVNSVTLERDGATLTGRAKLPQMNSLPVGLVFLGVAAFKGAMEEIEAKAIPPGGIEPLLEFEAEPEGGVLKVK